MRTCKRCEQEKQYPDEYPPQGRTCRACKVDIVREWRIKNPDQLRVQRRKYKANKGKPRPARDPRSWRERNREHYNAWRRENRSLNRERERAQSKLWRDRNRDKVNHQSNRRRMRLLGVAGEHSLADWVRLRARHDGLCAYCHTRAADTRDHIIPVSRGGTDYIGNVLPACLPCNSGKRDMLLSEWRAR